MLLRMENVKKNYGAFNYDCSIEVKRGQVTGLVGSNGAGKSTTFKSILGLIFPESGTIELFGKNIKKLSKSDREKIGVVLAEGNICELFTAKDMVPVMKAMYKSFSSERYVEMCDRYSVPLDKPVKEFSTGMKAKLKLILAMSSDAEFLILDEPTSGLDVIMRNELLDMLRDYMEDGEKGILISSHISSDLEGICDDLYVIAQGKIIMHEETDVLISEYGVLKVTKEQYDEIDKQYIIAKKEEKFGYLCLTNQKDFYMDNYPRIAIEKGNIDDLVILMTTGGKC